MVSLVYVSDYKYIVEHLGTASIKAYLDNKKIPTDLYTVLMNDDLEQFVLRMPSSSLFFGFPLFHSNAQKVYKLAQLLKKHHPKCMVFTGGPFSTLAFQEILSDCSEIDFIVLGDGEEPTYNAIDCVINKKSIKDVESVVTRMDTIIKQPGIVNLVGLPWPSREYLSQAIIEGNRNAKIYASRGCCGNCSFCSFNIYYRRSKNKCWYGRQIDDVYNEIVFLNKEYGIRDFTFVDGSFEDPGKLGKQRIDQLCDMLLSYPIRMTFWCWLRAETFCEDDILLIQKMKRAGFIVVYIGFEANNEYDLKVYRKRNTIKDNERTINLFLNEKIAIEYGYIMLNPYSNQKTLKENYLFLKEHNIAQTSLYTNRCMIYYSTDIYNQVYNDGLLSSTYSYLEPLNYEYVNDFAYELSHFIDENYVNSNIMGMESRYLEFQKILLRLSYLFPEKTARIDENFNALQKQIGEIISSYFEIIFIKNDILEAKSRYCEWEKVLNSYYEKGILLHMKLLKDQEIRTYLYGE